jgi:UDP-glucose 4-epimerase
MFPEGTETLSIDILDCAALERAFTGADVVVHLAALLHVVNPPPSLSAEYQRVNVEGTRNVAEAARAAGVRRLVMASTIAVYGASGGAILDESSMPRPETDYGRSKLESERVALSVPGRDGAPMTVVLRFGAIYGARIKGNYRRLVDTIRRGISIRVGSGTNRRTLIHERDAASAVVLAATHPAAAGEIYNATDGTTHTLKQIVQAMAASLGRRNIELVIPLPLARIAAATVEIPFRLLRRRPPVGRATIEKFTEDIAVSGGKIARELGFRAAFDLESGWRDAVARMRLEAHAAESKRQP